jgi:hypothetical protein
MYECGAFLSYSSPTSYNIHRTRFLRLCCNKSSAEPRSANDTGRESLNFTRCVHCKDVSTKSGGGGCSGGSWCSGFEGVYSFERRSPPIQMKMMKRQRADGPEDYFNPEILQRPPAASRIPHRQTDARAGVTGGRSRIAGHDPRLGRAGRRSSKQADRFIRGLLALIVGSNPVVSPVHRYRKRAIKLIVIVRACIGRGGHNSMGGRIMATIRDVFTGLKGFRPATI